MIFQFSFISGSLKLMCEHEISFQEHGTSSTQNQTTLIYMISLLIIQLQQEVKSRHKTEYKRFMLINNLESGLS